MHQTPSALSAMFDYFNVQLKKDLEEANNIRNKIKDANKKLEERVKDLGEQLTRNQTKLKSLKAQVEHTRKAQKTKSAEEEGAKAKIQVSRRNKTCCLNSIILFEVCILMSPQEDSCFMRGGEGVRYAQQVKLFTLLQK